MTTERNKRRRRNIFKKQEKKGIPPLLRCNRGRLVVEEARGEYF